MQSNGMKNLLYIATNPYNTVNTKGKENRERRMTLITDELKAKAEVYYGDEIGREKSRFLLQEVGLPRGLLPLKDIIEVGYVEETGFVWLKQKKKIEHTFKKIGKTISYGTEITAYAEKCKIKKLTGVKAKEILIWVTLTELSVEDPPTGKLTGKASSGLYRTFPTSAFELDDEEEVKKPEKSGEKVEESTIVDDLKKAEKVEESKEEKEKVVVSV